MNLLVISIFGLVGDTTNALITSSGVHLMSPEVHLGFP